MKEHVFQEETHTRRLNLGLWKKLLRYALVYRRDVMLLAVLAMTTAAIEVAFPLLTRHVVDAVATPAGAVNLYAYSGLYLALMLGLALSIVLFIRITGKIRTHVSHDIRRDGFDKLQQLSFSYFDRRPVGWLMARMTSDCERLSNILAWGMLDLIWGSTLMIGIAIAMLIMHVQLALVVLMVVPLLAWISVLFQQRILKSARQVRKTNSKLTATYNEALMGVRTSKVFVRERENLAAFQGLSGEMYAVSVRNAGQSALYLPVVLTIGSLATGLALAAGGIDVVSGALSIGTLIAFMSYTRHFFEPIEELANWFAEMQMAQAAAERVLGLIAAQAEIQDSPELRARMQRSGTRLKGIAADGYPQRINTIELRDVGFAYTVGEPVLRGVNLTVQTGETIALVGPTGGGKSTLVNLVCRFYEPTEGEILVDGVDYRRRGLHWLQSQLGMVLQTSHIFSGTVADNIAYGRLDADAAEIERAARLAGAHDFIKSLPRAYDSEVGEGGNRLSGGQKQLIAFARAILADPQIMILDEATSSVDTETERRIQQGLKQVLSGRIAFVIAHRLSTVRTADRILVIERGCIVEQGTHRELLTLQGHYHELYTRQSLREAGGGKLFWRASGETGALVQ